MHDIVLVTTGDSEVRKEIMRRFRNPAVVDCGQGRRNVMEVLEQLAEEGIGVLLTYRCPYLIPEDVFSKACRGAYNIHPSLLPDYPGLNPWPKVFEDKVRHSGVTLHRLSPMADSGEIVATAAFVIEPGDTLETARHEADIAAHELINKHLL